MDITASKTEDETGQPLVSVYTATYNSEATIIETLNGVFEQTYRNIELIISDDCSTDNTIELCRQWLSEHQERFANTLLLCAQTNKGTSANANKAESHCKGVWVKCCASDDILLPNCIEECVNYVQQNPDTTILFSRHKAFGANEQYCTAVDAMFDYSFFSLPISKQLHQLIFNRNCIPATTCFYNRAKLLATGIKNDERIPLLEDYPKWINLLKKGVRFHFLDKVLVLYRVGGVSTSRHLNPKMYESGRLFNFYYLYPERVKENEEQTIRDVVDEEMDIYNQLLTCEKDDVLELSSRINALEYENRYLRSQLLQRTHSKAYRIGRAILSPLHLLKKISK